MDESHSARGMDLFAQSASDAYLEEIGEYILVKNMSDKRHSVYYNPEERKAHLAIRGTSTKGDLDSLANVGTDIALMFGHGDRTMRMLEADQKLNQVKQAFNLKNKPESITASGHSLGGFIVSELVGRHNIDGHAYNPGSTQRDTYKNISCVYSYSRQCKNRRDHLTVHTVEGDPLSMGFHYSNGMGMKNHIKYNSKFKGMFGSHKMENFL